MGIVKIRVYRSDGDVKQELLREYSINRSEDLFVLLINLLLKNFNMLIEIVNDNTSNNSNNHDNENGSLHSSNDDHEEYWFANI